MENRHPEKAISVLLKEQRLYPPPASFVKSALVAGKAARERLQAAAHRSSDKFWDSAARELRWTRVWRKTLDWKPPFAKWFVGGRLNLADNCLDRHLDGPRRNKAAIIWEGEPGETRTITYLQLHREVCLFANALKELGVKKADRVAIYLPMVPEAAVAMLACSRIGAVHSVIFAGFSAEALRERIVDAGAKVVVTADGGWRKGAVVRLKDAVDEAVAGAPCVESVVILRRTGGDITVYEGRDHWWHRLTAKASCDCPAEPLDSEHPLFILYTSGSTGKPKGVLHTSAGYLVETAWTTRYVFDLRDTDVYWCTADVGWVTGHSYVVYGPLAVGSTIFMYEGAPLTPHPDRFWSMVERHRVSVFYTAPTAIRTFLRLGSDFPRRHDLSSLRLLGTVGEPINPEAWSWYRDVIGGGRCPIVDTWWQTETGAILISPLPGATPTKPGSATLPLPGIDADVVDKTGKPVPLGSGGYLVVRRPWPAMLRTIWGDDERYKREYWSHIPGLYFTGDGARRDKDGYFWILGRIDDVLNVAGHRLSTMEIESALVGHAFVAEAAVVGRPDEVLGQAVAAFVTLKGGRTPSPELKEELREHVAKAIGAIARPSEIRFTDSLPKTRSGKIMRRLLRELATGGAIKGDVTTLEDFAVLARLQQDEE
ncbi:MAG TPA: acetate--CoA ligase [Elusimicrobia bacterium]|nr:MAG: acetate--CoA ligase [Elusimicrobia bacterium GWA2_66_18]OGR74899.1 MAG: acetate--CoA ligase [Elusimicrobia bacterium GWC2_65_9]HAZ09140.1 acetate--CoA ligase [Elusimicrobiota bacterium]